MKMQSSGSPRTTKTMAETSMRRCLGAPGPTRHEAAAPASTPRSTRTTLDELIAKLLELRARGAGSLPVVIETRNRAGELIYGEANARKDRLVWNGMGFRSGSSVPGELKDVVRVG
jgi:hypothetical protein